MRQLTLLATVAASLAAVTVTGCVSTTQTGATGINRKQLLLVDSNTVNNLSAQSYQQDMLKAKESGKLNPNSKQLARLQAIANRIIPQVTSLRSDASAWKWEVNITQSDTLNAYCAPGGKIMFYSGIIDKLALTDDEIAAIMGHEIAHALREHGRERMSRAMLQDMGVSIAAGSVGMSAGQVQAVQLARQLGLDLPFGRNQETEADLLGLELMARAGYNPQASISLWQKMQKASTGERPKFFSTHPNSADRITTLQANIAKVLPLYNSSKKRPIGK